MDKERYFLIREEDLAVYGDIDGSPDIEDVNSLLRGRNLSQEGLVIVKGVKVLMEVRAVEA